MLKFRPKKQTALSKPCRIRGFALRAAAMYQAPRHLNAVGAVGWTSSYPIQYVPGLFQPLAGSPTSPTSPYHVHPSSLHAIQAPSPSSSYPVTYYPHYPPSSYPVTHYPQYPSSSYPVTHYPHSPSSSYPVAHHDSTSGYNYANPGNLVPTTPSCSQPFSYPASIPCPPQLQPIQLSALNPASSQQVSELAMPQPPAKFPPEPPSGYLAETTAEQQFSASRSSPGNRRKVKKPFLKHKAAAASEVPRDTTTVDALSAAGSEVPRDVKAVDALLSSGGDTYPADFKMPHEGRMHVIAAFEDAEFLLLLFEQYVGNEAAIAHNVLDALCAFRNSFFQQKDEPLNDCSQALKVDIFKFLSFVSAAANECLQESAASQGLRYVLNSCTKACNITLVWLLFADRPYSKEDIETAFKHCFTRYSSLGCDEKRFDVFMNTASQEARVLRSGPKRSRPPREQISPTAFYNKATREAGVRFLHQLLNERYQQNFSAEMGQEP